MTARSLLPERRPRLGFEIERDGLTYFVCIGFYGHGSVGEIFLSTDKVGSTLDGIVRDAGLLCSLLMQHGCSIETIRSALTRGNDGQPDGILGRALAQG